MDERFVLTDRRSFLKAVSIAGAGFSLVPQNGQGQVPASTLLSPQIENQFFRVQFDIKTGTLNAWRKNGQTFLINAISRASLPGEWRTTADEAYARSVEVRKVQDHLGSGPQLVAHCTDRRKQIDFEVCVTLYDGRNALVLETVCRNVSGKQSLVIRSLEPVRTVHDDSGACNWPGVQQVLTNGYMYYDPGRVEDFYFTSRRAAESVWNMGFHRGDHEEGLVVGFLENQVAEGKVSAWRAYGSGDWDPAFSLVTEAFYNREFVLPSGASVTSGRVIFQLGPDTFQALESYAQALGDLHRVHLNPIINGWCNWFFTNEFVSEERIIRNAEFVARHLKKFGMEYIQVDGGYQRAYADWEGNDKFPHGMKWLADQIHGLGLKAGIWLAPYCVSDGTEVQEKHPEWLVMDANEQPKLCGGNVNTEDLNGYGFWTFKNKVFGLDITHPQAAEWHRRLFEKVARDWGYDFIKIDFVEWTLLAADRYHDPTVSKAAAYRRGFEIIRAAIGPSKHLLDCGPSNTTVGILDSVRIEQDLPHLTWAQYVKTSKSSAPAMAKRYYFHKRAWINDADHLGLALLTIPQAQAAASIIALSGGTLISGDLLLQLDSDRLRILEKVLPAYGEAARPLDLFEKDLPEIFALPVHKNFADWWLVGCFNYDEGATVQRDFSLARLGLSSAATYLVYEFWTRKLLGEVRDNVRLFFIPSSVNLLSIHTKSGVPQVISTDRHITQGAVELETVEWNSTSSTLRGISLGPAGTEHNVAVYVPDEYRWAADHPDLFHDFGGYTVILAEPGMLQVHVGFEPSERVQWEVKFTPSA